MAAPDECAACRARRGRDRIAWERAEPGAVRRFVATCRDVLLRPTDTFDRNEPGSARSALAFAAILGGVVGAIESVLGVALTLLTLALGLAPEAGGGDVALTLLAVAVAPAPLLALAFVLGTIACALIHTAAIRALGGRAPLATSLWASGYLQCVGIAFVPLGLLGLLPYGELVVLACALAIATWFSLRLTQIGRRFAELGPARAAIAGCVPPHCASALMLLAALRP